MKTWASRVAHEVHARGTAHRSACRNSYDGNKTRCGIVPHAEGDRSESWQVQQLADQLASSSRQAAQLRSVRQQAIHHNMGFKNCTRGACKAHNIQVGM
jgi:hypothetical protein